MASINISDVSDGEIVEDFEEISSEEDYFEKVERRVQKQLEIANKRKLELELQNTLTYGFGKENYHRKRPSEKKRSRKLSRQESSRELARSRSYRASSVFSNYSIPKRKKREKTRSSPKLRLKYDHSDVSVESIEKLEDSEDDEELLDLRLQALKSKQEVKELIDEESTQIQISPSEEEHLRIAALKSAVLKKKEFFKERKKQKMLENERPYSPSDALPELQIDMSLSPLGSPFNEIPNENQEVDMEISNDEKESSDMDLAPSPQQLREIEEEEELALRSLVLTSIHKRKEELIKSPEKFSEDSSGNEQKMLTKSLKSVVQRLKQKKAQPIAIPARSGTKTIAMILAEQKGKKKRNLKAKEDLTELPKTNDIHAENFLIRTVVNDFVHPQEIPVQRCSEIVNSKPVLAVTNEIQPEDVSNIFTRPELPIQSVLLPMHEVQPPNSQDSSFSTITDTKNIPLLNTSSTDGAKKSRLVTSLEYVIKPVPRLIIPVRSDDTDTEEERSSPTKKTPRRIVKPPAKSKPAAQPEFEKNLENFLKNIRKEQEKKNVIQAAKPELSSVKHLPKSQQIEYQQLMQKLKVLEEAKEKALKARQLKRTKSISEQSKLPLAPVKLASPKKQVTLTQTTKTTNKIEESLSKIPLLDKTAQQRFIEKTEINLKNHSEKLFAATEQNLKLLAANEVDQNKQELITMQILELEKRLKRSKTSLGIINQRLKVNVHKVVQSSREMMKIHLHQKNFGKFICLPAGTIIKGEDYSLPDFRSKEINENFEIIAKKTEEILKVTNEVNVKITIKSIADKVKTFIVTDVAGDQQSAENEESSSIKQVSAADNEDKGLETMQMIEPKLEKSLTETDDPMNIEPSNIQKNGKRLLESVKQEPNVEKKLKYESPLDFLRLPNNKYE